MLGYGPSAFSSSPLTEFTGDGVEVINERSLEFYKNDYICGVPMVKCKDIIMPCMKRISCKLHSIVQKREVPRNIPVESLLMTEAANPSIFEQRRQKILEISKQQSNEYQAYKKRRYPTKASIEESIVLGAMQYSKRPAQQMQSRCKRKWIPVRGESETETKSSVSSVSVIGLEDEESGSSKSNTVSDTSSSTSKSGIPPNNSNSTSGYQGTNESSGTKIYLKEYVSTLSRETTTRIPETMTYLTKKLIEYNKIPVKIRLKQISSRYCY
ncbi:hypothetical protein PSN45_001267 [Yamadazyma tenuis]|uniref:uncharacterized protein n=1 Tax=Candida tenuis TaxID=2315449 RepID=UPI00279E31AF|nr:hypothetical protein PSN45_001267 [Yamadazyma tenuis]